MKKQLTKDVKNLIKFIFKNHYRTVCSSKYLRLLKTYLASHFGKNWDAKKLQNDLIDNCNPDAVNKLIYLCEFIIKKYPQPEKKLKTS